MKNPLKLAGIAVLSAGALATGSATATSSGTNLDPVYHTMYFSDASKTTQVGWVNDICFSFGVLQGPLNGQQTAHQTQILLGYCDNGVLVIF